MLMAVPMIVLYEICIWLAYFDRKKNRIKEEQEARESMERQIAREEKMRAEAVTQDHAEDHSEHDDPYHTEYPGYETGDDGWHDDYAQNDPHATDEIPEISETPPDKPEDTGEKPDKDV
jgi:hypothetical protein